MSSLPLTFVLEAFSHFDICQTEAGGLVTLNRGPVEASCLAFDTHRQALVELHLLPGSENIQEKAREDFFIRAAAAGFASEPDFSPVLEAGQHQGMLFYTTPLVEGESFDPFLARIGALPMPLVFKLAVNLSKALADGVRRLAPCTGWSLQGLMAVTDAAGRARLRVVAPGLSRETESAAEADARLATEVGDLVKKLLEQGGLQANWPGSIRARWREWVEVDSSLFKNGARPTLAEVTTKLREAQETIARDWNGGVVMECWPEAAPISPLQQLVTSREAVETAVKASGFSLGAGSVTDALRQGISAQREGEDRRWKAMMLPGANIIADRHLEEVPVRSANGATPETPHLLQVCYAAQGSGCRLMIEEDPGAITLAELLAARPTLNMDEALLILGQVESALNEAEKIGLDHADLHPSTIYLEAGLRITPLLAAKLCSQPLNQWPKLSVKWRSHASLAALVAAARPPFMQAADFDLRRSAPKARRSWEFASLVRRLILGSDDLTGALSDGAAVSDWVKSTFASLRSGQVIAPTEMLTALRGLQAPSVKTATVPVRVASPTLPSQTIKAVSRPIRPLEPPKHTTSPIPLPATALAARAQVARMANATSRLILGTTQAGETSEILTAETPANA